MPNNKPKILFIGEAVSLAHVTRPLILARSLSLTSFDVHFACDDRYHFLLENEKFIKYHIDSIPSEQFLKAVEKGTRLFPTSVLSNYVSSDLELIKKIEPDLVVGDMRVSLAVSAAISKVPYVAICNAHWSPYSVNKNYPLPDWKIFRVFGSWAEKAFSYLEPLVFSYHAGALNKVRKDYNLKPFKNFFEGFTHGDFTLYADTPQFVPTEKLPANHNYIGPISWSPELDLPDWWNEVDDRNPVIYMTMGSTGDINSLAVLCEALSELPVTVMLTTAGRDHSAVVKNNIKIADYLPGNLATERANIVLCNGGSATVYEALRQAVPVIGIASNMDQLLTMSYVEQSGSGIMVKPSEVKKENIKRVVLEILSNTAYKSSVQKVADNFAKFNAQERFKAFVHAMFGIEDAAFIDERLSNQKQAVNQ